MIKIKDTKKLDYFMSQYKIDDIFDTSMKNYMELHFFNKNDYIYKTDEQINYLYLLVQGKAKVFVTLSNGKSFLTCFYRPFMVMGDVELMYLKNALSNVQVIEETYCIGISYENIKQFAISDTKFLNFIGNCLRDKLVNLSKNTPINLLYPLENRLASYILDTMSSEELQGKSNIIFDGNLGEVADLLGVSYRHLLRTLKELCEKGAIKKSKAYYEILNINLLKTIGGDI